MGRVLPSDDLCFSLQRLQSPLLVTMNHLVVVAVVVVVVDVVVVIVVRLFATKATKRVRGRRYAKSMLLTALRQKHVGDGDDIAEQAGGGQLLALR